jgi:hypothetical protein
MNWKFRMNERPKHPTYEEFEAGRVAKFESEKARQKAEWDALPDHRKAARIEYKFFQAMCRKPAQPHPLANAYLNQTEQLNALYQGSWQARGFGSNPYVQMDSQISRALHLERGGFNR